MSYGQDLLGHAVGLLAEDAESPAQVDLRRAISASYYALFHFLIEEAVSDWGPDYAAVGLARMFEHGTMAKACDRIQNEKLFPFEAQPASSVEALRFVAEGFIKLKELRASADYDTGKLWSDSEAAEACLLSYWAIQKFRHIRQESIAKDFLKLLLIEWRGKRS